MSLIIPNEMNLFFASLAIGLIGGALGNFFATAFYHREVEHLSKKGKEKFYRICYLGFFAVLLFIFVMFIHNSDIV